MAAIRGTRADPECRPEAERSLAVLHEKAAGDEYSGKAVILAAVEQAWDAFQTENYPASLQHLSRALITSTRI